MRVLNLATGSYMSYITMSNSIWVWDKFWGWENGHLKYPLPWCVCIFRGSGQQFPSVKYRQQAWRHIPCGI